ncbi:MMPL family transporter [Streptomyces phaeochromogenes]|uniref:MMPL family transporter n=1 Tax=Streptomyces phaeochromogenes TaxID=1923 RepID=UPI003F4D18F6
MAAPITSMDLGLPGAGSRPTSDTSRRAYDLTTEHFGPGYNGPLTIVAQDAAGPAQAQQVAAAVGKVDGVASSSVSVVTNGIALITAVPTTGPNTSATADLVHHLREDRSTIEGSGGTHVLVGGTTATDIDVSAKLRDALPVFVVVLVGLAFILLTFAFRTILVPITSIIGFLLSVGAALGAEGAVFQWGWGKDLLGIRGRSRHRPVRPGGHRRGADHGRGLRLVPVHHRAHHQGHRLQLLRRRPDRRLRRPADPGARRHGHHRRQDLAPPALVRPLHTDPDIEGQELDQRLTERETVQVTDHERR